MLFYYIKVAYRNFMKYKVFNLSNILVLALVLASVLHLFRYLSYERSFDQFQENYDKLCRVRVDVEREGSKAEYSHCIGMMADFIADRFPEVADYTRISAVPDDATVVYEDLYFRENRMIEADPSFFKVFSFPLIEGDKETVLANIGNVVLTQTAARKYFGDGEAVGKILKMKGKYDSWTCKVTGVCADIPANSHIQFDFVMSNHATIKYVDRDGKNLGYWTYLLFNTKDADIQQLEKSVNAELDKNQPLKDMKLTAHFQPMRDIHLYSKFAMELQGAENGNINSIKLLAAVGFLCLIIAYLNYINVSTVRTIERSMEVGLRKVAGAKTSDNMMLFLVEALFQTLISFALAILLYGFTLFKVNSWFSMDVNYSIFQNTRYLLLFFAGFFIVNIIFSLIYSLIYARIRPSLILKGKTKVVSHKLGIRNTPVIVQFASCMFFISCMLVVTRQGRFIQNKDLGFNKDNIIMIRQPHLEEFKDLFQKMPVFDEEALKNPVIKGVTRAVYNPGLNYYGQYTNVANTKDSQRTPIWIAVNGVRYNFFDLYQMKLIAGESFKETSPGDHIIVNETAMKTLGYQKPKDILGESVYFYSSNAETKVVGVIEDYHQESLHKVTQPVIFYVDNEVRHAVVVKIQDGKFQDGIAHLEASWKNVFPENSFVYEILDQRINQLYFSETRFQKWLTLFSVLSVIICGIGIISIIFYTYRQRVKEVSIRKVLGASTLDIVGLSRSIFVLIGISMIIGLGLSFFISNIWLQTYAYHIRIGLWFVIVPAVIVLSFSCVTLTYTVIKASSTNPAVALRQD
jgi:putative ABC transport system permease protein